MAVHLIDRFFDRIANKIALVFILLVFAAAIDASVKESKYMLMVDFAAYYTAAELLYVAPETLYDLHAQHRYQQQMEPRFQALPIEKTRIYINPPHAAMFYMPFLAMSHDEALSLYRVLLAVTFLAVLFCVLRYFKLQILETCALFLLLMMAFFPPLFHALQNGQMSVWLLAGLLAFYVAVTKKHYGFLGLALFLFSFKPHLFVLMLIPLWFEFRHKGVLLAIAIATSIFVCTAMAGGIVLWHDYVSFLMNISEYKVKYSIHAEWMVNLSSIIMNANESIDAPQAKFISMLCLLLCLIVGFILYYTICHKPLTMRLAFVGWLLVMGLLLSPWTHGYSYTMLLVPIIFTLAHLNRHGRIIYLSGFFVCHLVVYSGIAMFLSMFGYLLWGLLGLLWVFRGKAGLPETSHVDANMLQNTTDR